MLTTRTVYGDSAPVSFTVDGMQVSLWLYIDDLIGGANELSSCVLKSASIRQLSFFLRLPELLGKVTCSLIIGEVVFRCWIDIELCPCGCCYST